MAFNENTRVKIPALVHLTRLGYTYLSLKGAQYKEDTNIFYDIFKDSFLRINDGLDEEDAKAMYENIALMLSNEDLGQQFYKTLTASTFPKIIDF